MENLRKLATNIFRTHRGMIASLIVILLLGLLSATWFRDDYLLTGTDFVFPPNRQEAFQRTFYLWDDRSLGTANPRILAWSVPQGLFLSLSDTIGLSLVDSQKIWFYFLFTLSGLSAFFLTVSIIKGNYKYLAGLTSGLFYMFNPFIAIGITTFPFLWLTYACLPLKLGLYIKGIKEKRKLKYIMAMCLVWWITSSSQYVNPKYLILDLIPLLLYLVFHILVIKDKREIASSLKFTGMLLALLGIFNFYWIFPTVFHLRETIEMPIRVYGAIGRGRLQDYILNSAPLIDAIRLLGLWAFHSEFKGDPYFNWASVYNTPLFVLAGYLIPLVAFIPSLFKLKDRHTLFFCLFTLAALLGMSGASPSFGWINVYLVTRIPLAIQVFNIPYQIFGMYVTLGYAFLFGYGITLLYDYILRKQLMILIHKSNKTISAIFIGFIIFLVIGMYAFSLWTGEIIQPGKLVLPSNRYRIPNYYYKAAIWIAAHKENFRIHPLPYSIVGYGIYRWELGGFVGPDPTASILRKPLVQSLSGGGIGVFVSRLFVNNSTDKISQLFALENVKYILFHKDTNWKYIEGHSWWISTKPKEFQSILNSQKGIHLEKKFGKLDFYKISDEYFLPHFYTSQNIIISNKSIDTLPQMVSQPNYKIRSVIYFDEKLKVLEKLPREIENTPVLEFKKINPTKYRIRVHNAKESFPLVFSESFHQGWKSYLVKPNNFQIQNLKSEILSNIKNSNTKIQNLDNYLESYKILEGNEEDQASREELEKFIEKGWVSTLGDGREKEIKHKKYLENGKEVLDHIEKYKIDFISKNFQGTIQNNNLPKGHIWDTWLASKLESSKLESSKVDKIKGIFVLNKNAIQLPEENHLMANGYANSWFLDLEEVKKSGKYIENPDGSIDFELVIEFWPQRLFYLGLFISGMTLLGCLGYLGYDWQKRRRGKFPISNKISNGKMLNKKKV